MTVPTPDPATEPDDPHPVIPWLTRPRRIWLYGVIGTLTPLLTVHGITSETTGSLWAAVALSIVGTGVVVPNTLRAPV